MKLSIRTRVFLAFLAVALMVAVSNAGGLLSTRFATENINQVIAINNQISLVENLKTTWFNLNNTVDEMMLSRQTGIIEGQLSGQVEEFRRLLDTIQSQGLGFTPAVVAQNQATVRNMQLLGDELYTSVNQIISNVQEGRWATAQLLRHTDLVSQRNRFESELVLLSTSLQSEADQASVIATNRQETSRRVWIIVLALSLLVVVSLGLVTVNSLTNPIKALIEAVNQVTSGASNTLQPLNRSDELGDLSRSAAELTDRMRTAYENLEQGVAARTRNLTRRTLQVETASQIARDVSATRNLDELLARAVNLIRDRFQFYHAGIFLLDPRGEYAVLRAATGEAGRAMLGSGHRLKVGEVGLVGYATSHGEARIAADVTQDFTHFQNPLLPETRSEIALPLKAGNQVIGALDVQSVEPNAFDQEDLTMLQTMADQLAVAIENARLVGELEESLHQVQTFYAQYGQRSWRDISQARTIRGFEYDQVNVNPILPGESADPDSEKEMVEIPLMVRDREIGKIRVLPESGADVAPQELALLQALSLRLGQTLESARLFEETSARAGRQQMLNELSANLGRSLDVDSVLRTVVQELSRVPAVAEVAVHVGIEEEPAQNQSPQREASNSNGSHNGHHPNGAKGTN